MILNRVPNDGITSVGALISTCYLFRYAPRHFIVAAVSGRL